MQCLKCGKKTADKQVFCEDCLAVMQAYPVKPGIPIHLPQRERRAPDRKSPPQRDPTPADQLRDLRTTVRWLLGVIAVLSLLLLLTAGMLIHTLEQETPHPTIGRNYTTADSTTHP
jgi:uncharacterized protein YbaR (Trm112 family)